METAVSVGAGVAVPQAARSERKRMNGRASLSIGSIQALRCQPQIKGINTDGCLPHDQESLALDLKSFSSLSSVV
jgi:hypothetical protein